jgi:hypothetical protein
MGSMMRMGLAACLIAFSLTVPVWAEGVSSQAPPVAQPLIREGDFAVRLAEALKIGMVNSEAEAEDMLTAVGIQPRNGWIADYPVTPDVYGEIWNSMEAAADAGRLPMDKADSERTLYDLAVEEGLLIADASTNGDSQTTLDQAAYPEPSAIEDYYTAEGPPVVSYYPPPADYDYLYAWVPYPFWWADFWFPGFWCLNDFNVIVVREHHGHHHGHHDWGKGRVTNHVVDNQTGRLASINPARRGSGKGMFFSASQDRGFSTAQVRNQASSIVQRSERRTGNTGRSWNAAAFQGGNREQSPGPSGGSNFLSSISERNGGGQGHFESPNAMASPGPSARPAGQSPGLENFGARSFSGPAGGGPQSSAAPRMVGGGGFGGGRGGGGFGGGHGGGGFGGGFGGGRGGGGGRR